MWGSTPSHEDGAIRCSKTLIAIYQTPPRHIPRELNPALNANSNANFVYLFSINLLAPEFGI